MSIHKDSQREWIKDAQPSVETNMGWIEHYMDPQNIRAVWDGWVAIVDKQKSEKYAKLVQRGKKVYDLLPYEKEL